MSDSPFANYTELARQVVVSAQDEARKLKHNYIGTEHLLLGLARTTDGLGFRVLDSMNITLDQLREHIVQITGLGDEPVTGEIPFTPRAKRALDRTRTEAASLGHRFIGTEHILLALSSEREGVAAKVLFDLDADSERVRNQVIAKLTAPIRQQRGTVRPVVPAATSERKTAAAKLRPLVEATGNPDLVAALDLLAS
jgi:ATP-dependent Clp protease ATP-binding subunit ClpC